MRQAKLELSGLAFLYSSRVWSRMGPVILKPPMEATTSVIVPTLARIASFNSAALSSEARERERGRGRGRGRTNMRQGSYRTLRSTSNYF